jgi:hypothetical protein
VARRDDERRALVPGVRLEKVLSWVPALPGFQCDLAELTLNVFLHRATRQCHFRLLRRLTISVVPGLLNLFGRIHRAVVPKAADMPGKL